MSECHSIKARQIEKPQTNIDQPSTAVEYECDLDTFNQQYFNNHKPVLIKGAIKDWPADKLKGAN